MPSKSLCHGSPPAKYLPSALTSFPYVLRALFNGYFSTGLAVLGSNLQTPAPSAPPQVPQIKPSGARPLLPPIPGSLVTSPERGSSKPRLFAQLSVKTIFPSLPTSSQCCPVCLPGVIGILNSVTAPVRGFSFPMIGSR